MRSGRALAQIRWLCPGLALVAILGLGGCDQFSLPAARAKVEEQARDAENAGDHQRAIRLYESLLDGTAKSAKIHYSLGLIYDDKLKDSVSALHHFRRFLEMSDDEAAKKEVRQYIDRLQLKVTAEAADSGIMTKREAVRLKNENLKLQEQVMHLQAELSEARKRPIGRTGRDAKGFSSNPTTAAAERAIGPETRTYTVQEGDTLASIARKFYKSSARWKDIADANQTLLNGSVNLKIGEVLIIPD
ncbi:MAG TPA: LysM domain-containing protein [Chthoniobacterales bacterium]